MKVEICKSVEIETEVDVSIGDFISELQHKLREIPAGLDRRESAHYFVETVSISIQILKAIPDEMIRQIPRSTLWSLTTHLVAESERWLTIQQEVANGQKP